MSGKRIQLKRGTTAQNSTFTGLNGEVTVDTTKKTLVVHDGTTVGGTVLAKDSDVVKIVNNEVINTAAKLDFNIVNANYSTIDNVVHIGSVASDGYNTTLFPHAIIVGISDSEGHRFKDLTLNAEGISLNSDAEGTKQFIHTGNLPTYMASSLALKVNNSEKGVANGVATLDGNGKVVLTQIPDSVLGQLEYMGTWNFTTMPTATQKGQYWIANTSGNGYVVGDWAVWNGSAFDKVDNTDAVASVAGRTGNVVLTKSDVGLANVDNTADSAKNVLSATKWTTARTLSLAGDVTGSASIDGSGNVTINATVVDDSHNHIIADVDGLQAALDNKVAKVTSTDNAIVRFNGTTGDIQNSGVVIDDNNNVGIGVTPSAWNSVWKAIELNNGYSIMGAVGGYYQFGNAYFSDVMRYKYSGYASSFSFNEGNTGSFKWGLAPSGTAGQLITWTNAMTLDANGNVGLGATPNSWNSTYKSIDMGSGASFTSSNITTYAGMIANSYIDSSGNWRLKNTGKSTWFEHYEGGFYWNTASSGSAGSVTTPINIMNLQSNGNLLIGTTTDNGLDKLQVNGSIVAQGISNKAVTPYGDANTATIGAIFLDTTGSANFPDTPITRGFVIVNSLIESDINSKEQVYYQANTGHKFTRFQVAGIWTSWKQLTN